MSQSSIRFSTDILSRLGEELNPSPDLGILELVKNSYDANAHHCVIELRGVHSSGGTIIITDDGDGMTQEEIENGWLVLGKSGKSKQKKSRLGRVPAGNKGLGRLAALRMGSTIKLQTRPLLEERAEYKVRIDWAKFLNVQLVEEVPLQIDPITRKAGLNPGSRIQICDLYKPLRRIEVKRLARALILLADPFESNPEGFLPTLKASEFKDLEKIVKNRYFEDADYHLIASIDEQGYAKADVVDWKGDILFSGDHAEISNTKKRKGKTYNCPATKFDLWAFILNSATFSSKEVAIKDVREWLSHFGGVHLYENGLRVSPYGNPGNDWLDLNLMRVKSPEERPSTNTSIGRVSVKDSGDLLIQKTDRSGFIESESFLELREFARDSLEWMARRRLEAAEKRRQIERNKSKSQADKSKVTLEEVIENTSEPSRKELKKAFIAFKRAVNKESSSLRREVQLYRTLSTAGITAATFAHESRGNPIKAITHAAKALHRRAKLALGENYDDKFEKPIQIIIKATDSLSVLGSATLRLLSHRKRRVGRVDVHGVIAEVLETFGPFMEGRGVKVKDDLCKAMPFLRGSEAAVESIVTNLFNNSLAAIERANRKNGVILLRTDVQGDVVSIRVLDNGPGIENISTKDIWLPGQTTYINGTGLGLVIVKDAVKDLGGSVDAIQSGELGGAEIIVELPILGIK